MNMAAYRRDVSPEPDTTTTTYNRQISVTPEDDADDYDREGTLPVPYDDAQSEEGTPPPPEDDDYDREGTLPVLHDDVHLIQPEEGTPPPPEDDDYDREMTLPIEAIQSNEEVVALILLSLVVPRRGRGRPRKKKVNQLYNAASYAEVIASHFMMAALMMPT